MIFDHEPLFVFLSAIIIDLILGELPNRFHPVVWMGNYIRYVWGKRLKRTSTTLFIYGSVLLFSGIILFSFFPYIVLNKLPGIVSLVLSIFLLTTVFSFNALIKAAKEVQDALKAGDLIKARELTAWHLVSRDTSELSEEQIVSAVIESVAENITDSFASPLFYYSIGGIPFALAYRFTNTSDSMIAYRKDDYEWGGKMTAWVDDILNWIPARLTSLLIFISSVILRENWKGCFTTMKNQHRNTSSPNAGWTMSAIAGALNIRLEKKGDYVLHGGNHKRSFQLIDRAIKIVITTMTLLIVLIVLTLEVIYWVNI